MKFILIMLYIPMHLSYNAVNGDNLLDDVAEAPCSNVCSSNECINEATFYLNSMDQTVDPCDDFYEFVCGNFTKKNQIPDDENEFNVFYLVQQKLDKIIHDEITNDSQPNELSAFKKLKVHYQNCINESRLEAEGVRPLFELIQNLGGWPVLQNDNEEDSYSWEDMVKKISALGLQPRFPIMLYFSEDSVDSTKHIIQVHPAKTVVTDTFLSENGKILKVYEDYMVDIAVKLGARRDKAIKEMKECLNFEVQLYKIQTPVYQAITISPIENRGSIKNISVKYPDVAWLDVLNKILNPSNVSIDDSEILEIKDPKYVSKIAQLINNTPKKVLANYQIWQIVEKLIDYMPQEYLERQFMLRKVTNGLSTIPNRDKFCTKKMVQDLPIAVSGLFIRKFFNQQVKEDIAEIVELVKNQAKIRIEKVNWMDEQTRSAALEKLDAMKAFVGYPDELMNDNKVEHYYNDLEINTGNYLMSYKNISQFLKNSFSGNLKKSVKEVQWTIFSSVAQVDAYYNPNTNQIMLPAGILQDRYFQFRRPKYLNYGTIGYVIGHEITHGFDSYGKNYDKYGNFKTWWKQDATAKFIEKTKCIEEQYSNYTISQISEKMNGKLTIIENIADNGGIKLAYYAYKKWANDHNNIKESCLPGLNYTAKQMFWISAASNWCSKIRDESLRRMIHEDFHSPSEARVTVAFSNIYEFSNDFKCKVGSKMNRINKCNVW